MQDPTTSQEAYREHGHYLIRGFVPRFFSDYLKRVVEEVQSRQGPGELCGDPALDSFAHMSAQSLSQLVGRELTLVKACARVYRNDDCVLPHTDEKGLDHSLSVFLGGEYTHLWPLWVQKPEVHKTPQMCALAEGDAVLYMGSEVHHWRDHFEGVSWCQLLVHYAEVSGDGPRETERAGEESL